MKTVSKGAEAKLLEIVASLRDSPDGYYALHYNLSKLQEEFRSEYQIKIAVNVLNDLFKSQDSIVFVMKDGDIILLYSGNNRALLEKAIFQLRYLFMDDPLGYAEDGYENEDFCSVYDLEFQWRDFFVSCKQKIGKGLKPEEIPQAAKTIKIPNVATTRIETAAGNREKMQIFTPEHLVAIISELNRLDIRDTLRNQPVCAVVKDNVKPIFSEVYTNISHLQNVMSVDVDLLSSRTLFKYLTNLLDKHVLKFIQNKVIDLSKPISINLNVKTLLTEEFSELDAALTKKQKSSMIIEINIADVFEDVHKFVMAKEELQQRGYRICLDGLDDLSFPQIDRKELGFDLAKLKWDSGMGNSNDSRLSDAVKKCGANRIILCRCDSQEAIDFGKSIGISLFQGRHIDNLLAPNAKVVN